MEWVEYFVLGLSLEEKKEERGVIRPVGSILPEKKAGVLSPGLGIFRPRLR